MYALLAGRSPFHTGTPISDADLVDRILHVALPPTGRTDVPPALERALARALARRPGDRFESAAAFGRALQAVERDLGLTRTALVIPDDGSAGRAPSAPTPASEDPEATRVKPFARVDPDGPAPSSPTTPTTAPAGPAVDWPSAQPPVATLPTTGLGDRTVARDGRGRHPPPNPNPPRCPTRAAPNVS